MSKKPVIVFEGIEGSGKTHHLNKISKYLKKKKTFFYQDQRTRRKFKFRKNKEIDT